MRAVCRYFAISHFFSRKTSFPHPLTATALFYMVGTVFNRKTLNKREKTLTTPPPPAIIIELFHRQQARPWRVNGLPNRPAEEMSFDLLLL